MGKNRTKRKRHTRTKPRKTRYISVIGGKDVEKIPDRSQITDFIFYNPTLNPQTGYVKYIIVNQEPKYLNIFDNTSYQIMEIEEAIRALSLNKIQIPAYKMSKKINTTRARTEEEITTENQKLKNKLEKLEKKQEMLESLKR